MGKPVNEFTWELEKEVEAARKSKGWEVEGMTLQRIEQKRYNEGRLEGRLETLFELVRFGLQQLTDTITCSSLSKEEFIEKMKKAGY